MSTLTSIKDGSLGASHMNAMNDGSLGNHLFEDMEAVHGKLSIQHTAGLGCVGCNTAGLGEYFSSGLSGMGDMLDTTPKKVLAGAAALGLLYFVGKQTKLIPNKRRRRSRRRRRK